LPGREEEPAPPAERDRGVAKQERGAFFAEARRHTEHVSIRLGDELIFLATADAGVGRHLFVARSRSEFRVLEHALTWLSAAGIRLPEDPVFVDVGANIGTTTVVALRRHSFASGVAIEPSPDNVELLRLNVAANGLAERVVVLPVAASNRVAEVELDVRYENRGGHRIVDDDTGNRKGPAVPVNAVTLDSLVDDGVLRPAQVGLLWIDAQKHEASVLAGATKLIDAGVPVIVAIRKGERTAAGSRPWLASPELRDELLPRLALAYTDVVVLRIRDGGPTPRQHPISDFPAVVDSAENVRDVLLARRPAS
jgi:FkbM family methyltransferase